MCPPTVVVVSEIGDTECVYQKLSAIGVTLHRANTHFMQIQECDRYLRCETHLQGVRLGRFAMHTKNT